MERIFAGQDLIAVVFDQGFYTPQLLAATTNPTLGAGAVQTGWWKRLDTLIIGGAKIQFGTSGVVAGSGTYYVTLPPFAADTAIMYATATTGGGSPLGHCWLRDASPVAADGGLCQLDSTADRVFMEDIASGAIVNNASPWTWAASDVINVSFIYHADPNTL